eukprot:69860-Pleurochrysis_carterae.AAC.2
MAQRKEDFQSVGKKHVGREPRDGWIDGRRNGSEPRAEHVTIPAKKSNRRKQVEQECAKTIGAGCEEKTNDPESIKLDAFETEKFGQGTEQKNVMAESREEQRCRGTAGGEHVSATAHVERRREPQGVGTFKEGGGVKYHA